MQGTNGEWGSPQGGQNEEIGQNSQTFVRNSYQFCKIFTLPQYSQNFIHMKFIQNLYEIRTTFVRNPDKFHVNFVKFATNQSNHTSKHTLRSHWHVIVHASAFEHLGNHHEGTLFARCHSVVSCPGKAMPVMAKWISDSTSALSALQTSSWCKKLVEEEHALLTDLDDGEVRGRGRPGEEGGVEGAGGGAGRDRLGGVGEEGLGCISPQRPHRPNRPLPHPQHLVHAGEVPAGQTPGNVQSLLRGAAVQVPGVGRVVLLRAVGDPQVKKSPLQPILGVREGRQPTPMMLRTKGSPYSKGTQKSTGGWWLLATISSMSTLCT